MPYDQSTGEYYDTFTEQYESQVGNTQAEIDAGARDPADLAWAAMADRDSGSWKQQLEEYARQVGVEYDKSDLEGVQRNTSYAANAGRDPQWAIDAQKAIYDQRATNVPGQKGNDNSGDANAQDRGRYVDARTPEGQYLKAERERAGAYQMPTGPYKHSNPVLNDEGGGAGGVTGGPGSAGGGMYQFPASRVPAGYVGGPMDGQVPVSTKQPVPLDQLTEILRRLLGQESGPRGLADLQAELRRLGVM